MASKDDTQAKAPPETRNVLQFLRSSKSGMKIRVGALNGKRVDYFKGISCFGFFFSATDLTATVITTTTTRQIRSKSPPLAWLCKSKKRTQSHYGSRGRGPPAVINTIRFLPPRRPWRTHRFIYIPAPRHCCSATTICPRRVLCMALRRFSMDYVCWRTFDGRAYAWCRDVPVVAPSDAFGRVVPEYCHVGFARRILWARDHTVDILHNHRSHSKPWNLDLPSTIRRRWCCES